MNAVSLTSPQERITNLLVICLTAKGAIEGIEPGKWTIIGHFEHIGDAKKRLRHLIKVLDHLKARAFIIQEADPQQSGKRPCWRTVVRFNEPELYLDQPDAVEASEEALENWTAMADSFVAPTDVKARPTPSDRGPLIIAASIAAAAVAVIGMIVALQSPRIQLKVAPISEFTRTGGIMVSIPDEHRAGWYVRAKIYPDKSVEIIDRFPAYARGKRWNVGDLTPQDIATEINRQSNFKINLTGISVPKTALENLHSDFR